MSEAVRRLIEIADAVIEILRTEDFPSTARALREAVEAVRAQAEKQDIEGTR